MSGQPSPSVSIGPVGVDVLVGVLVAVFVGVFVTVGEGVGVGVQIGGTHGSPIVGVVPRHRVDRDARAHQHGDAHLD